MILNSLNEAQQEAVRAPLGHQLILAAPDLVKLAC